MGSGIAQRLIDNGYQVFVYDRNIAKADAIAARGGVVAKNILELAGSADVILSCLTNDEAVQSVFAGPAGMFAEARPGTIVLEMSTISPESSRELHRLGAKRGIEVLDVAISAALLPRNKASLRYWPAATKTCSLPLNQYSRRLRDSIFFWAVLAPEQR